MAGLARHISKLGLCSRSIAAQWIITGRVRLNGRITTDPEKPITNGIQIEIDGQPLQPPRRCYLMLNKPRGLVTSASDEHGRDTVYQCLQDLDLPWVAPVGRLDKASEGLLLLSNDSEWAAHITDPTTAIHKQYHVQIDRVPDEALLARLRAGAIDKGEHLSAARIELLRAGNKHAWLQIHLIEGHNRQIRRLLQAHGIDTLRLIRVAIGGLQLGDLAKGKFRELTSADLAQLTPQATAHAP